MGKLKKHFVSDIDKKLKEFNETQPRSASQLAETEKYRKIFEQRDNANAQQDFQGDIWSGDEIE
jgi:hypothetical protein